MPDFAPEDAQFYTPTDIKRIAGYTCVDCGKELTDCNCLDWWPEDEPPEISD